MKIGKKYVHIHNGYIPYICTTLTPSGNAVLKYEGNDFEFVIFKENFKNYKEVQEKQKVYVFLYSNGEQITSMSSVNKTTAEESYRFWSKRNKVLSDIQEIEIEIND